MKSKHSSEELLLALLDGELTVVTEFRTRAHLRSCWECRARLARLEAAAEALAEARIKSQFLPPDRIDAARRQFALHAAARAASESPERKLQFRLLAGSGAALFGRRGVAFAWAGMLSVAAVVTVWQRSSVDTITVPSTTQKWATRLAPKPLPAETITPPVATLGRTAPVRFAPAESPPAVLPGPGVEQETRVWWVLHDSSLCRGQNLRVERSAGHLLVIGFVDTQEKRNQLQERLRELEFPIEIQLRDLEEAIQHAESGRPQAPVSERVAGVAAEGERLIRAWLETQKLTRSQTTAMRTLQIANDSVRWADAAWAEAWALRDLRGRFGPVWNEMPESSRVAVLSMVRDHWSELQAMAARQRQVLGGVLPAAPALSIDALQAVESWNQAVQALFAPTEPVALPVSALVAQISSSLTRVEAMNGDDPALSAFVRDSSAVEQASSANSR